MMGTRFCDTWLFDTAFAPELEPQFESEPQGAPGVIRLFGSRNLGDRRFSNLDVPGSQMTGDESLFVRVLWAQIWADGDEKDTMRFLDFLEANLLLTFIVGCRTYYEGPCISEQVTDTGDEIAGFVVCNALPTEERQRRNCRSYAVEFSREIHIPPRQCFWPEVPLLPAVRDAISSFPGRKQLRVGVGGRKGLS